MSKVTNQIDGETLRLSSATVNGLKILYTYDENGFINGRYFSGNKQLIPSTKDLLKLVEAQYLDHINRIELISLINRIAEITEITTITNPVSIRILANAAGASDMDVLGVLASSTGYLPTISGNGKLVFALFHVQTDLARDNLQPRILVDGVEAMILGGIYTMAQLMSYCTATSPTMTLIKNDTTNHFYTISVTLDIPFTTTLKVGFYNSDPNNPHDGLASFNYDLKP